ncbi:MAG: TIGR00730 family Rossman fold protein [bacterium]|nr:TIGR00730 family Rossman fold protein [bacterium]
MSKRVCVFCGSADGVNPAYRAAAVELGNALAERGWTLVYGGGRVGLMGAVADAALAKGGRVIGVIPRALVEREVAHTGLTELHITETMHQRKALMAELSDSVVTLPGGFGTLDEIAELVTWAQLGYHRKPLVLLNTADFYAPFLAYFDHMSAQGFIRPHHRGILVVRTDIASTLETLETYQPPLIDKWLEKKDL